MASKSGAESDGKRLRKNWSDDSMLAAKEAVRTSKMSISVATNRFKVPQKTLDDRLKVVCSMELILECLQCFREKEEVCRPRRQS